MKWSSRGFLLIIVVLIGCKKDAVVEQGPSEGQVYLDIILDLMEKNSVHRDTINWTAFRDQVLQKTPGLKTIAQTSQAIQLALRLLNDHHSFYKLANTRIGSGTGCVFYPLDAYPPSGIGYLRIHGFGLGGEAANEFATSLQTTIKNRDQPGLKGWLVDLRGNEGGNMWPMIAGVGPILGESIVGYFIYHEDVTSYSYKDGASSEGEDEISTVSSPYSLINPNPKVAVLIDAAASSGEATTIAFIGRPNTRLFGATGSCGLTTAVRSFTLSDGATLGIAFAWMADRNKNKFEGPIIPDEISNDDDSAVAAAIAWLSK